MKNSRSTQFFATIPSSEGFGISLKNRAGLRQYLYSNDNEEQPFSRKEYEQTVISGKYKSRMMGFGSVRDFDKPGYYIRNAMFPKQREEMHVNQTPKIETQIYKMDADNLFKRKEHAEHIKADPYFLHPDDVQVIGEHTCEKPFYVKGLVGQSAMSYGSLGERAVTALSKGSIRQAAPG